MTQLNSEIVKVVSDSEIRSRLPGQGVDAAGTKLEEFGKFLRSEIDQYARVIREGGLKTELVR